MTGGDGRGRGVWGVVMPLTRFQWGDAAPLYWRRRARSRPAGTWGIPGLIAGMITVGAAGPAGGRPRHDRRPCHFHPGTGADFGRTRPVACLAGSGD